MEVPSAEAHETQLIERAARGDTDAFATLFHHYYSMIHAFAYRLCFENSDAQDIAQETFIKAARALGTFRRESSFKHWLYGIAANTSRDWRRSKLRASRIAEALSAETPEEPLPPPADLSAVGEALGALADDLRQAIVLVYYEGLNHAEAARICDCAETTISWRVFTAKRKLKRILERRTV
ncbi:MAG: hypothetical protein QOE70_6230 [Chthoniobacter sp.]|jgi:RNA polymerase sigma-70 factor (ECF subfamily)|nr:hypothetical protein [Chthoniobacter sp.]